MEVIWMVEMLNKLRMKLNSQMNRGETSFFFNSTVVTQISSFLQGLPMNSPRNYNHLLTIYFPVIIDFYQLRVIGPQ